MGGIETQTVLMARELAKLGVDVTLVTLGKAAKMALPGLRVAAGPLNMGLSGSLPSLLAAVQWTLLLLSRAGRLDIVQAQSVHPMGFAVALAGHLIGVRSVARISSSGPHGEVRQLLSRPASGLRRSLMGWVSKYVALSQEGVEDLPEPLRCRAVVIPNGVDLDRFRPPSPREREWARAEFGLRSTDLVYCYTGRLLSFKAVDELILAWHRAAPRPSRLLVVGSGPEVPKLMRLVVSLGAGRGVVFAGSLRDVRPALWAADVLVQPSRVEGFSNSVLEAMACGLSVVVRNLPCYSSLVEPEATFEDLSGLGRLMATWADPVWRSERATHNLEKAARLGADRIALRYLELYRGLLSS